MNIIVLCLVVLCVGALAAPNNPAVRLIGGTEAIRGQFPYLVSVRLCIAANISEVCQHVCGGAIVDSTSIVTAAHCITDAPAPGRYEIVAGILNLDDDDDQKQLIRVKHEIIHPQYQGGIGPYDLAVLRLEKPLQFTNFVRTLMLSEMPYLSEEVLTAGWGSIGQDGGSHIMPNTIHYIRVPIISAEECQSALDKVLQGQPHPLDQSANICTGPLTGGVSICLGDSGGPVVDLKITRLLGISSWTVTPCGTVGAPSVHNKVYYFGRWINDTILNDVY